MPPTASVQTSIPIPPLKGGERLSRDEFERRYNAMPSEQKAELIEGVVYMAPAAVSYKHHGSPHFDIIAWLSEYVSTTPGTAGADNASVRLNLDSEPQPDAVLLIDNGGQCSIDDDDMISGAPELCVEVSASSAQYDLTTKLNAYRNNGVREYVIWRTLANAIDWFVLRGDKYESLVQASDGILKSETFPGLWLDVNAMLSRNMIRVREVVRLGASTPEHAAFAAELASRKPKAK